MGVMNLYLKATAAVKESGLMMVVNELTQRFIQYNPFSSENWLKMNVKVVESDTFHF